MKTRHLLLMITLLSVSIANAQLLKKLGKKPLSAPWSDALRKKPRKKPMRFWMKYLNRIKKKPIKIPLKRIKTKFLRN